MSPVAFGARIRGAYATKETGRWVTQVVHQPSDDSGESGMAASLALGPNDQVAIAHFFVDRYSTGSARSSRLLYHERRADGTWASETVASSSDGYVAGDGNRFTGFAPHLLFDSYVFTSLPQAGLTVTIAQPSIHEGDQTTAIVTRHNGDDSDALRVTLANGDATELTLPSEVVIPAGSPSATIRPTAVQDGVQDGAQTVRIMASAADYLAGSNIVHVSDVPFATLRGREYEDRDGDGCDDAGEPGLAGWTIFLDADGDGQLDANELSCETDQHGNYAFEGLVPGTYWAVQVPRPGWLQTVPGRGRHVVELIGGEEAEGLDFGALEHGFHPASDVLAIQLVGESDAVVCAAGGSVELLVDGTADASFFICQGFRTARTTEVIGGKNGMLQFSEDCGAPLETPEHRGEHQKMRDFAQFLSARVWS